VCDVVGLGWGTAFLNQWFSADGGQFLLGSFVWCDWLAVCGVTLGWGIAFLDQQFCCCWIASLEVLLCGVAGLPCVVLNLARPGDCFLGSAVLLLLDCFSQGPFVCCRASVCGVGLSQEMAFLGQWFCWLWSASLQLWSFVLREGRHSVLTN